MVEYLALFCPFEKRSICLTCKYIAKFISPQISDNGHKVKKI
jgi:hypothetical protein